MDVIERTRVMEILTDEHPMLSQPSAPIGEITDEVRELAADMLETMYAAKGIGLAAVQVGHPVRMLVLDAGPPDARRPVVMIDPVIDWSKKLHVDFEEGCLSIPGRRIVIARPADVKVTFTDLDGVRRTRDFGGLPARIVQHEIDHLDGIVMTKRAK